MSPIYEYRCESCGRVQEALEPHSAPTEKPCECGETANRITSATQFRMEP